MLWQIERGVRIHAVNGRRQADRAAWSVTLGSLREGDLVQVTFVRSARLVRLIYTKRYARTEQELIRELCEVNGVPQRGRIYLAAKQCYELPILLCAEGDNRQLRESSKE